ncbi:hypothetical protein KEM54_001732 [Ascosphaera aggregata]|nr:hypothetical protein KEM54_001732 [Ascosphaera aggregata]
MVPASKPVIFRTSSPTSSDSRQNNGFQTSSLTTSFLSAFSSRPSSSRLSSGVSGIGNHFPASSLAQRLSRRDNLWQGPSILRNRNLSPHFEGLKSRPTTPNIVPKSPSDTVDCHLAPFQSPGPSTPHRSPNIFEGLGTSSYDSGRSTSPDRASSEGFLSTRGSRGAQSKSLRNAISLDAIRAVDSETKMGTQNIYSAPQAWSSPLSPASPNSSRRMAKGDDGKVAMPVTPRTEQYIQHLETQVATLTESISSNASNNLIRKVKQLTRERASLQRELSEWEKSFETRVQDELVSVQQHEAQLAAQVRALQIDNRLKDHKITEQAREITHTRQRLSDSQSTNHELEQRIDDLTGLLAQSPAILNTRRPQTASNKTSCRLSESTRHSPRLPVRPTSMVNGSTKENEITPIRRASTSIKVPREGNASPGEPNIGKADEGCTVEMKDNAVFDATNAPSVGQPSIISSEPSELRDSSRLSSVSSATSAGDLTPSEGSTERHSDPPLSRRKMRKFPSGAHQLKPLVLQNSSEQPEKIMGRARCNSLPYTPSRHAHPTPPAYRFPRTRTDLHSIAYNERYQGPNSAGSPRSRHGNTRSHELARGRTLDALEGGPHQCQFLQERVDLFRLSPLNEHNHHDDGIEEIEPSSTDCVVPGVSSPTLSGHNSNPSLLAHSPPASDLGVEIEPASVDCDTTTLWQEQQKTLKTELLEVDISGLDGVIISDGSRHSHQSVSQSPNSDTRSGSLRYKFRRPTIDKIMEAETLNSRTNMVHTPVLYRDSPFELSSRVLTPVSRRIPETYDCLPQSLSPESAESLGETLYSAAHQLISNTRYRVNQLHSLWIGSFSWIFLGLFLHRRDSQPAFGDNSLDYSALYEAPEAHRNQISLIDGFKYTMTRRFRTRVASIIAAPVIERSRKSSFINSLRCWSHLVVVMVFALGFAARYGASDLIETEPAAPKQGRCPLCGAIAHESMPERNIRGSFRADNAPSKADSSACRN